VPPKIGKPGHGASFRVPGRRKWRNAVNGGHRWNPSGPLMQPMPSTSMRHAHRNAFWKAMPSLHHAPTWPKRRPGVKLTKNIQPMT
jgi:hypothetical protein